MGRRGVTRTAAGAALVVAAVAALVDFGGLYLDGLNSAGLAAHTLMFTSAEYEPPDSRPVLTTGLWSQFVLDNCASVDEAVAALRAVRVEPTDVGGTGLGHALPDEQGRRLGVHLSVEDASGDTAVFEPVAGRMLVTHGRQYQVMANSPSMPEQLANLARYRPFGGDLPAPAPTNAWASDREYADHVRDIIRRASAVFAGDGNKKRIDAAMFYILSEFTESK